MIRPEAHANSGADALSGGWPVATAYERRLLACFETGEADPRKDKMWDAAAKEVADERKQKEEKADQAKKRFTAAPRDGSNGANGYNKNQLFRGTGFSSYATDKRSSLCLLYSFTVQTL
jgi:hypothetical protein